MEILLEANDNEKNQIHYKVEQRSAKLEKFNCSRKLENLK